VLSVGLLFLFVLVDHILVQYCQLLQLVRLLHGFLRRDGIVERNGLCASVCHWCCCCLLVASVVDVIVVCACVVRVSATVLVEVVRFVSHAFSSAPV